LAAQATWPVWDRSGRLVRPDGRSGSGGGDADALFFSCFCSFVVLLQIINRMSEGELNRISKRKSLKNSLNLRLNYEYLILSCYPMFPWKLLYLEEVIIYMAIIDGDIIYYK
jgi:hypothetical protein